MGFRFIACAPTVSRCSGDGWVNLSGRETSSSVGRILDHYYRVYNSALAQSELEGHAAQAEVHNSRCGGPGAPSREVPYPYHVLHFHFIFSAADSVFIQFVFRHLHCNSIRTGLPPSSRHSFSSSLDSVSIPCSSASPPLDPAIHVTTSRYYCDLPLLHQQPASRPPA